MPVAEHLAEGEGEDQSKRERPQGQAPPKMLPW